MLPSPLANVLHCISILTNDFSFFHCSFIQIQAAFRTDEIRRSQPAPQDEMRAGMSYFHETIWNGLPKFLRRVDTALKGIGVKERLPHDVPLIQFSSWMGGDRDGNIQTSLFSLLSFVSPSLSIFLL